MGCACFAAAGENGAKDTGPEGTERWPCGLNGALETKETILNLLAEEGSTYGY